LQFYFVIFEKSSKKHKKYIITNISHQIFINISFLEIKVK
jgi:hypothetical protein